jgi:hypothetical protein
MNPSCRSAFRQIACVVLLAGLLLAGCGRSGLARHEVSGSVSFAGEKVSNGAIVFTPIGETKGPRVGGNIQQGQYHIDHNGGPLAGRHRVEITCIHKTGRQIDVGRGRTVDQTVNVIPAKYSGETSTLVVEIKSDGKNVFDFDLKTE